MPFPMKLDGEERERERKREKREVKKGEIKEQVIKVGQDQGLPLPN